MLILQVHMRFINSLCYNKATYVEMNQMMGYEVHIKAPYSLLSNQGRKRNL